MLRLPLALLSFALLPLAACQSSFRSESITPDLVRAERTHAQAVAIHATGAGPIKDEDLAAAVRSSLEASGLFSAVRDDAPWRLEVTVISVSKPEWGLDMVSRAVMRWQLSDETGAALWAERLTTRGEAGPEDAYALGDRAELSRKLAVRKNLAQAVERMANLDLPR